MKLFGVLDEKKKGGWICIFLGIFQLLEMNEKKNWCSERMGYCPLYCKTRFVLQGLKCIVT